MSNEFPQQQLRQLLLEYLSLNCDGHFTDVIKGIIELAKSKNLYSGTTEKYSSINSTDYGFSREDHKIIPEKIRQLFWELLIQGIIIFGKDEKDGQFPWYRVTEYGEKVLSQTKPAPYDPDNFINEFTSKNPKADKIIIDYLKEAVNTFNHGCYKAASVMLGCASEQAILILHEKFKTAIQPSADKIKFENSYHWTIHSKFEALQKGLEYMIVTINDFKKNYRELVRSDLNGTFELIRRHRNEAGHPNLFKKINRDTLFMNLTIFSEFISQIYKLISYFDKNNAKVKV